jgi:chromosome segregation ATPase
MSQIPEKKHSRPAELLRSLHELDGFRNQLIVENQQYKDEIHSLASLLETAGLAISSSDETVSAYKEKRDAQLDEIEKLTITRNNLANRINQSRLKLKAVLNDTSSSSVMVETMERELENIENEKMAMQKRMAAVGSGIQDINDQKVDKMPDIMVQDKVLKNVYRIFKEAEDRMEVCIRFSGTQTESEENL